LIQFVGPVLLGKSSMSLGDAVENSLTWLVWYVALGVLGRFAGREHPPVEGGELSPRRRGIAIVCLAIFVLLFMPTPLAHYGASSDASATSSTDRGTADSVPFALR
jgi:hypothetical protein